MSLPLVLQTPRLLLRDLLAGDADALNVIEGDAEVTRYMSCDPQTPEQTREYIAGAILEQAKADRKTFDLAIVLREGVSGADGVDERGGGELIGRCGLGIQRPEHREATIWYLLHPQRQGRGYITEAASAMLDFAFGTMGVHRVFADCDPRNTASCRVASRLGMRLEGQLRENYSLKGEWCSSNIYGILESEWAMRKGP